MSALKSTHFEQANQNLSRPANMTAEECSSLWVYTDGHECISCWKLSFLQRMAVLFWGRIWLSVLSGYTQPPVWLDCGKTVFAQRKAKKASMYCSERWHNLREALLCRKRRGGAVARKGDSHE